MYSYCIGILAGGTNSGHVAMWKYNPSKSDDHPWELQPPSEMEGNISQLEVAMFPFFYKYQFFVSIFY